MDNDERSLLISRIGTFFILLGLLLIILFIASDIGSTTYFSYFFIGAALLVIGWIFKRSTAHPAPPSGRFEGLRKIRQKSREAKAKKETAKKDKKK